jgi:hypothetical protein
MAKAGDPAHLWTNFRSSAPLRLGRGPTCRRVPEATQLFLFRSRGVSAIYITDGEVT